MLVLDFETIKGMNIPEKEVYDWCNEAWRMKDRCVLPVKSKMWEGGWDGILQCRVLSPNMISQG